MERYFRFYEERIVAEIQNALTGQKIKGLVWAKRQILPTPKFAFLPALL